MGATEQIAPNADPAAAAAEILAWYGRHFRRMPWRAAPGGGERADPYRVWLSEIMLQQTTVVTVGPYFAAFLDKWPDVEALAAAPLDDVLTAWAGLGYYARARNLHKCAQVVSRLRGGRFPKTYEGLLDLPGVGPYTAAAIAAIAFDEPATVVDGNVERVMARLFAVAEPLPGVKPKLKALAATLTPDLRPGDYAQAVMDLGATVCTPRKPRCGSCPWAGRCLAQAAGIAADLPARAPKAERPTRTGTAYWAMTKDGRVLLRQRPTRGLLGGMMEVPGGGWDTVAAAVAPLEANWRTLPGMVRHTFTHFHLELTVMAARLPHELDGDGRWVAVEALGDEALPSVMQKVVRHALAHEGDDAS